MKIIPGIEIVDLALWLKKEKTLIISDIHLGYEETLEDQGILVPRFQLEDVINRIKKILKNIKPKKIIINGDLKHAFNKILDQEWRDALKLIDFLKETCSELILIKGNHDVALKQLTKKREVKVKDEIKINNILITHGDKIKQTSAEIIIIGHEHPAITLKDKHKSEKYKCFLVGKYQKNILIVMPCFKLFSIGSNIKETKRMSPYLENISNFKVYVVGEKVLDFGKVSNLP